jgi:hypothetical protein
MIPLGDAERKPARFPVVTIVIISINVMGRVRYPIFYLLVARLFEGGRRVRR